MHMNSGPNACRRIDEMVGRMEDELRGAIAYVNGSVVPGVRKESIVAMRTIAGTLHDMANRMEKAAGKGPAA